MNFYRYFTIFEKNYSLFLLRSKSLSAIVSPLF